MKAAVRGALIGAAIGIVVSQLLGLVVIGTDDIPDIADSEDLPVLYVVAAVIGVLVGAGTGAAGLVVAVQVARSVTGTPARRRLLGALGAAGCSIAVSLVFGEFLVGPGLVALPTLAAVGGIAAWLALPGLVDLTEPAAVPAWGSSGTVPAGEPLSVPLRVLLTAVVSGAGAFIVVNVVMSVVSLEREVADVVALVVLAVAFVGLAVAVWRGSARMIKPGAQREEQR